VCSRYPAWRGPVAVKSRIGRTTPATKPGAARLVDDLLRAAVSAGSGLGPAAFHVGIERGHPAIGSEDRAGLSAHRIESRWAQRAASGIVVGVDTHKDLHVARAKDELGRGLGEITIPASAKGYRALLSWSRGLGEVRAFGVEGSGCYGAGLARHLRTHGEVVIEVIRPTARQGGVGASPIRPMPRPPPRRCSPVRPQGPLRQAMPPWR
jgi:hypothetical protein